MLKKFTPKNLISFSIIFFCSLLANAKTATPEEVQASRAPNQGVNSQTPLVVDTDNRKILACEYFARSLAEEYNVGRYDGVASIPNMISPNIIYCVFIFKKPTPYGFEDQRFYNLNGNIKTGVWEGKFLN